MTDYSLFRSKAPGIMENLISDFEITANQAAAILGNLGHECAGFRLMQEQNPRAGRGGYGWAQWTGDRRRKFAAWADQQNLPLDSDAANYGYLRHELKGSEKGAVDGLRRTASVEQGVRTFEKLFERAGVKHYPSRDRYARIAKDVYGRRGNGHLPVVWDEPRGNGEIVEVVGFAENVLSFGMRGPQVKTLQEMLASLDYPVGKQDGLFGGITRAAVLAFQADNQLDTTGVVDHDTWEALTLAPPRPLSRERTTITPEELLRLGSTIIQNANRTKNLAWLSGILGVLGLTTSAASELGGAGGAIAAFRLPPGAQDLLAQLSTQVAAFGGSKATAAKNTLTQLQTLLTSGAAVTPSVTFPPPISGTVVPVVTDLLPMAAGVLPGFPGSLLALGVGIAAHYFSRHVIQARTKDHRDGSNTGR